MAMPAAPYRCDALRAEGCVEFPLVQKSISQRGCEERTVASWPQGYRSRRQDLQLDERLRSQDVSLWTSTVSSTLLSCSRTLRLNLGVAAPGCY